MIVVKVPGINGLGKTAGTRNAGNKLIEGFEFSRVEEIHVDNSNLIEQEALIVKNARKIFEVEDRVVFLGGDHSISYPLTKCFFEKFPSGRLVVFDAHADAMLSMKEPTHEEWLRALIERTGLNGEQVMIVGLNKFEDDEKKFFEDEGVKIFSGNSENLRDFVKGQDIYVSVDVDIFEEVKATGYADGRMSVEEVFGLLDVVLEENVDGCDLVEINLEKSGLDETLNIGKKILQKFIS